MSDDLRTRIEELRRDLGRNIEETVDIARTTLNWRHFVATHPWLCLTTAAVAGYLLVPKPKRYALLGPDAVADLKARGFVVVKPEALPWSLACDFEPPGELSIDRATSGEGPSIGSDAP